MFSSNESFGFHTDGFASNMKKTEPTINNADSQALLKQVALTESLGGWEDGILTIGTLGYDPLKSINPHKEYFALEIEVEQEDGEGENIMVDDHEEEQKGYNAEHEELNPLIYNSFEHNFENVVSENNHDDGDVVGSLNNEIVVAPPVISYEVVEANDVEADEKKKKGERITLADLFLADTDVKIKLDPYAKVCHLASSEKPNLKAKHGLSFAKKLIPRVKDNPHPMKDIKKVSCYYRGENVMHS